MRENELIIFMRVFLIVILGSFHKNSKVHVIPHSPTNINCAFFSRENRRNKFALYELRMTKKEKEKSF